MGKLKLTKNTVFLTLITILSAVLNFVNLSIEGTANSYYAAAVKSMTLSFKNFFFVSFDPSGFVTIDKPPLGFWLQAISAKIFGFSGWSIILPQALAGVLSVIVIYFIVKRSFGNVAGLISSLCLAITPTFVAASRNNTVDNVLVLFLLLSCLALSIAAEKGKLKYLIISMVLLGLGFNVKMLQAYMIAPALYITYIFSTSVPLKKRFINLVISTVVLIAVSLSWTLIVDSIPASQRPYVDSSTNNTVKELIVGHNGLERLGLSSSSTGSGNRGEFGNMGGKTLTTAQLKKMQEMRQNGGSPGNPPSGMQPGQGQPPSGMQPGNQSQNSKGSTSTNQNTHMQGGFGGGNSSSNLQGGFGGQITAGITRLFSKNILSDQIIWFFVLAVFGFIASAIKEKLTFRLDNVKKQALVLWFMWLLPAFIFFSYTTGTFHPYYLTMLAPPIAALTGIGITSMWELYKEKGWKSWFLPVALIANGAMQLLMLYYFKSSSNIVKGLIPVLIVLCFGASIVLIVLKFLKNENLKLKKALVALAMVGLLVTPFVGSGAVLFYKLNNSFPAAGLELLSNSSSGEMGMGSSSKNNSNSKLVKFLLKNKTKNQKYLLVVSNSTSASEIIISTGQSVMSLGGFLGNNNPLTLEQFKAMVKKGEIRYVMTGGQGGQGGSGSSNNSKIMSWVKKVGKLVSSSKYSDTNSKTNTIMPTQNNNTNSTNAKLNNNANNTKSNNSNTTTTKTLNTKSTTTKSNSTNSKNATNTNQSFGGFGGDRDSSGLYDLKSYTDSVNK